MFVWPLLADIIILKMHEITDVVPQFFPAGKNCG